MAALDRVMIWGLDCCGDDAERIALDEFVECGEVEICMGWPEIHFEAFERFRCPGLEVSSTLLLVRCRFIRRGR